MTVAEVETLPNQHVGSLAGVLGGLRLPPAELFHASRDDIADLLADLEDPGTTRAVRVNALRLLVAAGGYRVDAPAVARRMLRRLPGRRRGR